ncbi:transposase [Candidatus Scalindua japonica]|uniref:transposase n=1 Tax=Candidatus Scalindua japonica TaxID=1284222 RepID=UPI003B967FE8
MDNHYLLLRETNNPNISKGMQWFGTTYTRQFNIKHKRNYHLFQGRFKSFLIENDEYLMLLSCYIHRAVILFMPMIRNYRSDCMQSLFLLF